MKDAGSDEVRASRLGDADRKNYETEINLARRQALLRCAVPTPEPQPMVRDLFVWGPSAQVLDLGCGNGWWAKLASDRTPDGAVIGLDLSAGMLEALVLRDYALSLEDPVRGWTGIDALDFARVIEHVDGQLAEALASGAIRFVRRVAFFTARK
jgi:SAM-dependent methyltransferase